MKKLILHFHLGYSGGGVKIEGGVDLSMVYGTPFYSSGLIIEEKHPETRLCTRIVYVCHGFYYD